MAVWSLILQLKGGHPHTVWFGDPLIGIGGIVGVVFALIVAFLTGCCYISVLRLRHRRAE